MCKEYFKLLLNVKDDRKSNVPSVVSGGIARRANNRKTIENIEMKRQEYLAYVCRFNTEKAAGEKGILNEIVNISGIEFEDWLKG
jgi:hypothetical protein